MKRSGPVTKYKRTNFPKYARAANIIGRAYKAYRGRTQTKSCSPKSGLQGITTFQKDVKQVYRYKRAPKKLRRRWKRSRKTFISNLLKQEGSRKYHYSGQMTWQTTQGTQGFFGWMNYGVNGNGGVDGSGDMGDVQTRLDLEMRSGGTPSDLAEGGANSRKYYFDHMRARIVLTNTGTTPIFWEIFECTARKDIPVSQEGGTLKQFVTHCADTQFHGVLGPTTAGYPGGPNSTKQTSAVTAAQTTTVGITPFQFRHFCQNFKINKVTRLQAAAGNTVSFDASQPRNVTVTWDNYLNLLAKAGLTKMYLVRQWGTTELIGGVPMESASSAVCEVEKDYNCKLLDSHVPQLNYFTYTNTTES